MSESSATQNVHRYGGDYETHFSPKDYLSELYAQTEGGNLYLDILEYVNLNWINAFATGDIQGERLLEFGCGPSLNTVIPSSRRFAEIYMCEYAAPNRQAVQDWLDAKPSAHDWTPFLKLAAEKEGDGATYQDIDARLRSKIKMVIKCDIHKDNPFEPNQFEQGHFDCITTNLCLESAVKSDDDYKAAIKKLGNYLKPGGHLILGGVLNQTFYPQGDQVFRTLPIRPELVEEALGEAGFSSIKLDQMNFALPAYESDCSGVFFVTAVNNSE